MSIPYSLLMGIASLAVVSASDAFELKIPPPLSNVSDYTSTLTIDQKTRLERKITGLYGRMQVSIAIFSDMQGEEVVPFAVAVFNKWGVGKKGEDKGVLILIAKKERKVRFEIGYGLEPILTDAVTKQILNRNVKFLGSGDYYSFFDNALTELDGLVKKE